MEHTAYYRKRLIKNLIQFAIGATLLLFVGIYLSQHPQERASLFTGIKVVSTNGWTWMRKRFLPDAEARRLYDQKVRLINDYGRMAHKLRHNCDNDDLADSMDQRQQALRELSLNADVRQETIETLHTSTAALATLYKSLWTACPSMETITLYDGRSMVIAGDE